MFYAEDNSGPVRQGDIFKGLVTIGTDPSNFLDPSTLNREHDPCFSVNLGFGYAAIITPCCDIEKRAYLVFSPLLPFPKSKRKNDFLNEEPTRYNIKVDPQNAVAAQQWENFTDKEKQERLLGGKVYPDFGNFVYERHKDLFSDYLMIDFNFVFNISRKRLGERNEKLIPSRVLRLSNESRKALRVKLGRYYYRDPDKVCPVIR